MDLAKYRKCLYCKNSGFTPEGIECTRDGKNTPCDEDGICDFFEIYNESTPEIRRHEKCDLKRCGWHGCNVTSSIFNDNCKCIECFGTHCHTCGVRQTRTNILNHFKNVARCAFCQNQK